MSCNSESCVYPNAMFYFQKFSWQSNQFQLKGYLRTKDLESDRV